MGTTSSKNGSSTSKERERDRDRAILLAMPSWCIDKYIVDSRTVEFANASWRYSMSGEAKPFLIAKGKEPSLTPLVFFYNQFYYFLFELLPDVRPLFHKGMKAQGRMLANVIKYIITNLSEADESILRHSLQHLARVHNQRGITADQYSVMGMVLVHTVRICTGPDFWTDEHKNAWVQIYSKMMSIIIPVVISGDMPIGVAEEAAAGQVYRKGNLNASEGDESKTPSSEEKERNHHPRHHHHLPSQHDHHNHQHHHTEPIHAATIAAHPHPGLNTTETDVVPITRMNTCPAHDLSSGVEDTDVSQALTSHFQENAAAHVALLTTESSQSQLSVAEAEDRKYKILGHALDIGHRVETYLRELPQPFIHPDGTPLPPQSITGHKLLRLLQSHNWVSDLNGAKTTSSYFLQLGLMYRVSSGAIQGLANLAISRNSSGDLIVGDDSTVYQFGSKIVSHDLTPPDTRAPSRRTNPPLSNGTPDIDLISPIHRDSSMSGSNSSSQFTPKCYVADIRPVNGILNALSPGVTPSPPVSE